MKNQSYRHLGLGLAALPLCCGLLGMTKGGVLHASDPSSACPTREGSTHFTSLDLCSRDEPAATAKQRFELPVINNHAANRGKQMFHTEDRPAAATGDNK